MDKLQNIFIYGNLLIQTYSNDNNDDNHHHHLELTMEAKKSYKILWDFNTQSIQLRRPDLIIVNKKRVYQMVNLVVPAGHRVEMKKSKTLENYQVLTQC